MEQESYFQSYEDLRIHEIMLRDRPRNRAYRKAIEDNIPNITGKIVLDVGTGTGILAILFAKAGAKRVYAVEASKVYMLAQKTVHENQLSETIQVIHGPIESVELPEKVDIIVSEWMGFYLLHEAMLTSVLFARNKYLKPNGLMFPETATLYSAPCSLPSLNEYWDEVEGVSMKSFADQLRQEALHKPLIKIVNPEEILSDPEIVVWLDLKEVTYEDISKIQNQQLAVANKDGIYQGICLWFNCTFPSSSPEIITLSTEPEEPATHWKQSVVVLPVSIPVEKGTPIAYSLSLTKSINTERRYSIEVTMLEANEVEHPEYCNCHLTKCILIKAMLDKYEKETIQK